MRLLYQALRFSIALFHPRSSLNRKVLSGFVLLAAVNAAQAEEALEKGDRFLKAGREKPAVAIYEAWLAKHPDSLHAELRLAEVAIRRFDYPKARQILETALAQHPDSPLAAAWMGRLFQFWGQAEADGLLREKGRPTRNYPALAHEHFRQAETLSMQTFRPDPTVLAYLAEWQLTRNDMVSAEANLTRALEINPACVPALQGQTRFYAKARDIPRAKDAIMHAMELDPMNSESYFLVAQLFATVNRPEEAVRYAEKSEALDFGRLPARDALLAAQYDKLGESDKALTYYERLSSLKPADATVWMKLSDLYGALHRPSDSLSAYRKALSLNPDILSNLYKTARADARSEKIQSALSQWRKIFTIQGDPQNAREAIGMIAGLHYLDWFLNGQTEEKSSESQTPPTAPSSLRSDPDEQDEQLLDALTEKFPGDAQFRLDQAKLQIARDNGLTDATRATLQDLCRNADLAIAGEATFLLGDDTQAADTLESVDGLSADAYVRLADRLLLDQELSFSSAFYQRARQMEPGLADPIDAAIRRIQAKQALAAQKLQAGDIAFDRKDYAEAAAQYRQATEIYRQWEKAHLRLADTYERLKQWPEAKRAYDKAISLSPGLKHSPGFAKHYRKLTQKAH